MHIFCGFVMRGGIFVPVCVRVCPFLCVPLGLAVLKMTVFDQWCQALPLVRLLLLVIINMG